MGTGTGMGTGEGERRGGRWEVERVRGSTGLQKMRWRTEAKRAKAPSQPIATAPRERCEWKLTGLHNMRREKEKERCLLILERTSTCAKPSCW